MAVGIGRERTAGGCHSGRACSRPCPRRSCNPYVCPPVSVRASVHACIRPSVHPSVRASVRPCIRPSVRACVSACTHPSAHVSMCPRIRPCICVSMHPSVRASVRRSVRMSVHACLCACSLCVPCVPSLAAASKHSAAVSIAAVHVPLRASEYEPPTSFRTLVVSGHSSRPEYSASLVCQIEHISYRCIIVATIAYDLV